MGTYASATQHGTPTSNCGRRHGAPGRPLRAAPLDRLEDPGRVERQRGTRAMTVTGRGRRGFNDLGLELDGA